MFRQNGASHHHVCHIYNFVFILSIMSQEIVSPISGGRKRWSPRSNLRLCHFDYGDMSNKTCADKCSMVYGCFTAFQKFVEFLSQTAV